MASIESTCLTLIIGVEDLVVVFRGSGRLRPQSPVLRDKLVVVMTWRVGYGSVAVSDDLKESSRYGGGSGGGSENSLEVRRSAAPGDTLLADAIVPIWA